MKMFDYNAKRGEWCKPLVDNIFKTPDGGELEIGMYVEPDDGTYTLHIFDNDDVILCQTIEIKNE